MTHDDDSRWSPGHRLERLVFFSDAVFAIAITLLIIEVDVPHLHFGLPDSAYWQALAQRIPNFIGFVVSFFVIGAFWAGHHRAFACARHWDQRLVMPNQFLLLAIVAMPFFTAFMSANAGNRVPSAMYSGWLLLTAMFNIWLQRVATSPPVVDHEMSAEAKAVLRRRGVAVALGAAVALVISLFQPFLAQPALATMPLWRVLLDRMAKRGT